MSNAIPYVVVEHTATAGVVGKRVVTEHASKKAAHTYAKELRAAGKSAYAHNRADAIKFGLITHTGA
jgi:hypothetical protein